MSAGVEMTQKAGVKPREKNFTSEENAFLLECVADLIGTVENKKTDSKTVRMKKEAWELIAEKFRENSDTGNRSAEQLYNCWRRLKAVNVNFIGNSSGKIISNDAPSLGRSLCVASAISRTSFIPRYVFVTFLVIENVISPHGKIVQHSTSHHHNAALVRRKSQVIQARKPPFEDTKSALDDHPR